MAALYVFFFFSSMLKTKLKIFGHLLCLLCMNGNTFSMCVCVQCVLCVLNHLLLLYSPNDMPYMKCLFFYVCIVVDVFIFIFFIFFLSISFFFPTKFICYARVFIFFVGICVCCLYFRFQCAQTFIKVTLISIICYAIYV